MNRLYWLIPIAAVLGGAVGTWRLRHGADLERGFARDPAPPPAPVVEHVAVR